MNKHQNLHTAKKAKQDEFYTRLTDIEKELHHYKDHFRDKVVFCNCDDPEYSNFWHFFSVRFNLYGLKKLIATHYEPGKASYMLSMERQGDETPTTYKTLDGDGDFRSPECIALLQEADIVVTNPPFSLFREYVAQLMEYGKQFLIIGNMNAITYKETFPLIRDNRIWVGHKCFGGGMNMIFPADQFDPAKVKKYTIDEEGKIIVNVMGVIWYTNLDFPKRHEDLNLFQRYSPEVYPKYENYDAIEVGKVVDIPCDYDGVMGVPITFIQSYNPEQFEIIGLGIANLGLSIGVKPYKPEHREYRKTVQKRGTVDGDLYMVDRDGHPVVPYARILIRKKVKTA